MRHLALTIALVVAVSGCEQVASSSNGDLDCMDVAEVYAAAASLEGKKVKVCGPVLSDRHGAVLISARPDGGTLFLEFPPEHSSQAGLHDFVRAVQETWLPNKNGITYIGGEFTGMLVKGINDDPACASCYELQLHNVALLQVKRKGA